MNPKYSSTFTMVNILLGAGPLILPNAFFQGGLILSSIWMLFIAFISYNSAMYIAQAMTKIAYIDNSSLNPPAITQSLLTQTNNRLSSIQLSEIPQKKYDHMQQFAVLYGQNYRKFPIIAISIYLTGTAISKCIMTGNILSKVFKDVQVLDKFYIWLGVFFLSGAAFSFKSIQKTKGMQFLIIIVRLVSIILMIFGAIYIMFEYGIKTPTPKGQGYFNISNFAQIFSNSLFSLLCHHSIPSIANQVKNTTDTSFFIKISFLISSITLFIIPLTACFAFGQELNSHKFKYYNFDFQSIEQTKFIFYIVSFYVFLNIAAFSVYIIVIRTNILRALMPTVDPMKMSKQTILSTSILLIFILAVSILLQDYIQYVLDFTGGIFGSVILFFIPALQVYSARKRVYREGDVKNYFEKLPIFIMCLGGIFMSFNLYQVILKLSK